MSGDGLFRAPFPMLAYLRQRQASFVASVNTCRRSAPMNLPTDRKSLSPRNKYYKLTKNPLRGTRARVHLVCD